MLQADAIITLDGGQYRLREALASSAYGLVWRARAPNGTAEVALKLINRAQMARAAEPLQERWVASAHKEIAFLRSLAPWDERHIVRLLDSGTHEGLPVMALELMGSDLGRHVAAERQADRTLALSQVLDWLVQVNQALAKVHQYGWRYLDLKPANVLFNPRNGGVKLADFGTSRLASELAQTGYAGTASWQAPEQFFPGPDGAYHTDARSDYFALGAMFYYLVCAGLPLRFCSDCGKAYTEHQADGAAMLRARNGGQIPPTLQQDETALFVDRVARHAGHGPALALLRALLAPEPGERPHNAIQISRMLAAARAAVRAPAFPALPRYAPWSLA